MISPLAAHAATQRARVARASPRIVILHGPLSDEDRAYESCIPNHVRSYQDVRRAAESLGASAVDLVEVDLDGRWAGLVAGADLAVINMHGEPGEDGSVQGLLRRIRVPFAGSGVEASAIGLNKFLTKLMALSAGLRTPSFIAISGGVTLSGNDGIFARDRLCKPMRGGSSRGVQHVSAVDGLPESGDWIVETYLPGLDATVAVVERDGRPVPLPGVVLHHGDGFYDAGKKLTLDTRITAQAVRPPELLGVLAECEEMAAAIHRMIGARHISRCDFVIHDGRPYFLEINTLPGMSRISNAAECAYASGLDYEDFIALVLGAALESG